MVAPFSLESLSALSVSAVSPDWLIKIANVLLLIIGFLYLNSEATIESGDGSSSLPYRLSVS